MSPEAEFRQSAFEDRMRSRDYTMADVHDMLARALHFRDLYGDMDGVRLVDPLTGEILKETRANYAMVYEVSEIIITRDEEYNQATHVESAALASLTVKERKVMDCLFMGMTVEETAQFVKRAPRTVHVYQNRLFKKIGAYNRAHAVRIGIETGLVNLDLYEHFGQKTKPPTNRELEVVNLLSHGLGTSEIADRLGIAPKTTAAHKHAVYRRLRASNASQAVLKAFKLGFLRPDNEHSPTNIPAISPNDRVMKTILFSI